MNTSRNPLLSIIIPNYCYSLFFRRFFTALFAQDVDFSKIEVVFVDDGSSDDSLANAHVWQKQAPCGWFEIISISHTGRPGAVRNVGLRIARGEYLVCIDPDDICLPGFLSANMHALVTHPGAGIVYTDYVVRSANEERVVHLPEFCPEVLAQQNIVSPPAMMRRYVWEQSQGFRTNTDYEDWDFWIQAAGNGFGFFHVSHPLYVYSVHEESFFSRARKLDGQAKALIVLNNKKFFPKEVVLWAYGVLRGDVWAASLSRGIIPGKEDVVKLRALADALQK